MWHLLKLEEHERKMIICGLVAEYFIKADISERKHPDSEEKSVSPGENA